MLVVHKNLNSYGRGGGLFTNLYTWSIVDLAAIDKANNAAKNKQYNELIPNIVMFCIKLFLSTLEVHDN